MSPPCERAQLAEYGGQERAVTKRTAGIGPEEVYDLVRNVWKWVADWNDAHLAGDALDSADPASGPSRVSRGDALGNVPRDLRSACRAVPSGATQRRCRIPRDAVIGGRIEVFSDLLDRDVSGSAGCRGPRG